MSSDDPTGPLRRIGRFVPAPLKKTPAAAAVGNASLFGVGYLILGRRRLAATAAAGSVLLMLILAAVDPPGWAWRAALILWWAAAVAHAWRLARGPAEQAGRRARAAALASGAVLIVVVALIAVDARRIGAEVTSAHEDGDCAAAESAAAGFGGFHTIVDGPLSADVEAHQDACELLLTALDRAESDPSGAADDLEAYIDHPGAAWEGATERRTDLLLEAAAVLLFDAFLDQPDVAAHGFRLLTEAVESTPDRAADADAVVAEFTGRLALSSDDCTLKDLTDWLISEPEEVSAFEEVVAAAVEVAPEAILDCADSRLEGDDYSGAAAAYRQLLSGYPEHELAAEAQAGLEVAEVRVLLNGWPATDPEGMPDYCDTPAPYSQAPAYTGSGPHAMALFGADDWDDNLPDSWLAEDITDAALFVCVSDHTQGTELETCHYTGGDAVTLYASRAQIVVYEVRTGSEVYSGDIEVGGDCPTVLTYWDTPPDTLTVTPEDDDVRSAFQGLVEP